ncbi:hypothetical protein Hanom_Chr15g01360771 [Helianthus anomalus]
MGISTLKCTQKYLSINWHHYKHQFWSNTVHIVYYYKKAILRLFKGYFSSHDNALLKKMCNG